MSLCPILRYEPLTLVYSDPDQTPVQKWQTKDVSAVSSEKSKHVRIDIGGPSPISLHFNAGSKDNADSIVDKLQESKALSSAPTPRNLPPVDTVPRDTKKASVHFSPASPDIIPPSQDEVEEEEEEEEEERLHVDSRMAGETFATALYDFTADGEDELSVTEGERLAVLEKDGDEWWKCKNAKGAEGVVPASYLEVGLLELSFNDDFKGSCRQPTMKEALHLPSQRLTTMPKNAKFKNWRSSVRQTVSSRN